ncbi:MAG: hypothetical protein GQ559_04740, partial [Desulfobulbaceae bacterium]|nr:hypothetical protein [Desulfobulbaceae bacterium]
MALFKLTYKIAGRRIFFVYSSLISLVACILIAGCVAGSSPTEADRSGRNTLSFSDPDKLRIVDCMLPGRVHRLGTQATFISPRRPQKMVAGLCEIRGGEYVAYDRADLNTSLRVWLVEAETGGAGAQTYVGEMYEQGLGTEPDYIKAAEWYRKAAAQGFARAQMNLGYLYEKGLGVPVDKTAALNWYRKASGLSQDYLQFASLAAPLKKELEESRKYSEDLESRLTAAEGQLNERRRELESTRKKRAEQNKVPAQSESGTRQQLAVLAVLDEELKMREQALEERQLQIAGERNQLIQRAGKAERAYEGIKLELQTAKNREAELHARLAKQQEKAGDLQLQLEKFQQMRLEKQKELDDAQVDLQQTRADLEQRLQQPSVPDNTEELRRLTELVKTRKAQVDEMHEAFVLFSTETDLQRAALADQLATAKSQEDDLRSIMESRLVESADQKRQLRETEEALQSARADLKRQGDELGTLSEQLELTRTEALEKQQQLELYVNKASDKEREQGQESDELTLKIETLKRTVDELKIELARNKKMEEPPIPGDLFSPEEFGDYYALIIGNSRYKQLDTLPTAKEDAIAVQRILEDDYGFDTTVLLDADYFDVLAELFRLQRELKANDRLLIYYTGHGYLDKEGNGWWQPVNASSDNIKKENWLDDRQIAEQLDLIKARHILIVADSCYSTQWTARSDLQAARPPENYGNRKTLKKWVRRMLKIETRMVLTSGGVRPVVASKESKNSIFTRAFLDALQKNRPILEGSRLAYEVYQSVSAAGDQPGVKGKPTYVSIRPSVHRGGE